MGKRLVEDCLTLDLAWLMRLGPIRAGQAGNGEVNWRLGGDPVGTAQFRLDLRARDAARLILRYAIATPEGKSTPVRQEIALTAMPQHFGGHRWWLICPVTGEKARVLYLPQGGNRFASRKAWGLSYRVERLSRFDRPFEKLFRVQQRLGGRQGLGEGLQRPEGMWRRTFARHVAALEQHDLACIEQIATRIRKA
jgi:hypothetical protein